MDQSQWPMLSEELTKVFKTKTRDEWCELMEGTDVCFAPILDMDEAPEHPLNRERQSFFSIDDVVQPSPAPKFSRTAPDTPARWPNPGADTDSILAECGYTEQDLKDLREKGVLT